MNAGSRECAAGVSDGVGRDIHCDNSCRIGQFRRSISGAAAGVENTAPIRKARRKPVARQVLIEQVEIDEARYDALARELKPRELRPSDLRPSDLRQCSALP